MLIQYKSLLKEFVAIKSVSTIPGYEAEIEKAVEWLENILKENDFEVRVIKGEDNPIVFASYIHDPKLETVLIYGHYDVQPAEFDKDWYNNPFELYEKDNRLYGRGAIDNKGQILTHLLNILGLKKQGKLKYNIKYMIEGNEETGSPHIEEFLKEHKDLLKADFVLLSDGEVTNELPTLEVGFKGCGNCTLTIETSDRELHSGLYGGAVPNAAIVLNQVLAKLFDEKELVKIKGFYDDVDEVSTEVLEGNKKIFNPEQVKKLTGTKELFSANGYDFYTQTGLYPTIQITGLKSGYFGEGYKNSVPPQAVAKINFRLAKSQKPAKILEMFKNFLAETVPSFAKYTLDVAMMEEAFKVDLKNKYTQETKKILEEVYSEKVILRYSGGGMPIVEFYVNILEIPIVLLPLANEDSNMHGANENFDLKQWEKSMEVSKRLFSL